MRISADSKYPRYTQCNHSQNRNPDEFNEWNQRHFDNSGQAERPTEYPRDNGNTAVDRTTQRHLIVPQSASISDTSVYPSSPTCFVE
jgi:hypothetical protein